MHGAVKRRVKSLLKKVVPKQYQAQLLDLYSCSRYFGSEYECLFCGGHFRKLLPCGRNLPVLKEKQVVGGGYRLARCPRFSCQSSDRERLLFFYLKNKTNIFSEKVKLLHVAPEKNLRQVLIGRSNIDYLSADLCSPTAMLKLDITDIHYEDCAFDVIICNHVLEHIPDDRKAMSELYRVLRPDGWAILQVPISLAITETYEIRNLQHQRREKKHLASATM